MLLAGAAQYAGGKKRKRPVTDGDVAGRRKRVDTGGLSRRLGYGDMPRI